MKTILENLSLERGNELGYDPFASQYNMEVKENVVPETFNRTITVKQRLLLSITQVIGEGAYLNRGEPLTMAIENGKKELLRGVYKDIRPALYLLKSGIMTRNLDRIMEAERIISMFVEGDVETIAKYEIPYRSST